MSDVALRRIEPEKNMARFYVVGVERTPFGDGAVVRSWGRIGSRRRSIETWFSEPSPAGVLASRLEAAKRRRGYRERGC